MKTMLTLGALALALMASPAFAEETKGVQWTDDYAKALTTAKADNKRLFIEFTAEW
ncbi:MAG: hypothetical protein IT464_08470 [Planctomycetes bacterium]|nr:hypothetical protein [Planctomycetota bacterium]MCC7509395.1 hypothetical protein [Planctomycetota bacterium]